MMVQESSKNLLVSHLFIRFCCGFSPSSTDPKTWRCMEFVGKKHAPRFCPLGSLDQVVHSSTFQAGHLLVQGWGTFLSDGLGILCFEKIEHPLLFGGCLNIRIFVAFQKKTMSKLVVVCCHCTIFWSTHRFACVLCVLLICVSFVFAIYILFLCWYLLLVFPYVCILIFAYVWCMMTDNMTWYFLF